MLIVGAHSTCDVCMENYMEAAGIPHVIPCGHIFCRRCLDQLSVAAWENSLSNPQCPICRAEFFPRDIHQLRVDSSRLSSRTVTQHDDPHVQRLLDDIEKIVDGRATIEEMQRAVDHCNAYHNSHPNSSLRIPLRASLRLLTSFLEAHKKLIELTSTRDDIRERLIGQLEFVQSQYRNLEQLRRSEKETVLRNEETSGVRYDEMNTRWRSKVESMMHKCQSLCEELDLLRQSNQMTTHGNTDTARRGHAATPRRVTVLPRSGLTVFNVVTLSLGCVLVLHAFFRAK